MFDLITTKPGDKYRSIRNPRMYRALRRQGYSKESAARITNARSKECSCSLKESLGPGITRIRGNLCNVHGRYGPCDAAASGKKPKKGRAAKKPVKTPEQRRQERTAAHDTARQANRDVVRQAMADADQGLAPKGFDNLMGLATGTEPDQMGGEGLIKMGMVERGQDGVLRMTPAGRSAVAAANRGDAKAAIDAVSRGADRAAKLGATKPEKPVQPEKEPKGGGGGGKKDDPKKAQAQAAREQERQADRTQRAEDRQARIAERRQAAQERAQRQQERDQAAVERQRVTTPELADAARKLSSGEAVDKADVAALVRNGLARVGKDGTAVLTSTGLRATRQKGYAGAKREASISAPSPISLATVKSDSGRIFVPQHGQAAYSSSGVAPTHSQMPGGSRAAQRGHLPPETSTVRTAIIPDSIAHLQVYKDTSGVPRWLLVSSTAYRDRDKEIVSTKALSGAVALADASGSRGPLRFWHVPGVELGDCDFQATAQDGRFLIESGTFRDPALAAAVKAKADRYQVSIGFTHPANEPDSQGVFHHIAIFERSLVPRGRASNPFTEVYVTKEQRMLTDEKQTELKELTKDAPGLLEQLLANITTTDKAAQDGGATYKDDLRALIREELASLLSAKAAPPPPPEAPAEMPIEAKAELIDDGAELEVDDGAGENMLTEGEIASIATAVVSAISPLLDIEKKMSGYLSEMKGLMGGMATQKDAAIAEVKGDLEKVKAQVADLSGSQPRILAGGYRASQASATVTTDETKIKEAAPSADPVVQSFGAFMQDMGFGPTQPGA